jgi:hypothetical protein
LHACASCVQLSGLRLLIGVVNACSRSRSSEPVTLRCVDGEILLSGLGLLIGVVNACSDISWAISALLQMRW